MTFDPTAFTTGIDDLRNHWLNAQPYLTGRTDTTLGFINSKADEAGLPTHHAGGMWEPTSNHQAVSKGAWELKMKEIFERMDACLRTIRALDTPELEWHIAFRRNTALPSYRMIIHRERISQAFVKTAAATGKRLSLIADALAHMPLGATGNAYVIDYANFRAASATDAVLIRSTLRGTTLSLSRPRALSQIVDEGAIILDPETFDIT